MHLSVRTVDYDKIERKVREALRKHFSENTAIDTNRGYGGRVHAKLVSPNFNGLSETEKQQLVWDALRQELGEDVQDVALVLVYGTDEYP